MFKVSSRVKIGSWNILKEEVSRTLNDLGFSGVKFTFDTDEAAGLIKMPGTTVLFADALCSAVDAFLHDLKGTGVGDSPAGLIKSVP